MIEFDLPEKLSRNHRGLRSDEFDYIIVGAGTAGCVLANRLTEDPEVRVLLLEAGGRDIDPLIHIPLGLGKLHQHKLHDWKYLTEPEPGLDGRRIDIPRGKVLGGSSSINVMSYTRGHRADFDRWARNGAIGWSYEDVLPYFKLTETAESGDSARGTSGPIGVQWTRTKDPICGAWIEAAALGGYPFNHDTSSGDPVGIGRTQYTIRNGRRSSAATAYLKPARSRPNLVVRTRALATKILIENHQAVGIEYHQGRAAIANARARREVILSGGAINTPQLLMLSGIGPAEHLHHHSIPVIADLPVGKNLQDHLMIANVYARKSPGELHAQMRFDRMARHMLEAYCLGTGYATSLPSGVMAFIKSNDALEVPDLEFLFPIAPIRTHMWLPGIKKPYNDAFTIRAALLHPESRGEIALRSDDPFDPPALKFNFLTEQRDIVTLREGFRIGREIAAQEPMDAYRSREMLPGAGIQSDAEIDSYIRQTVVTVCHPASTCPMGLDSASVLDPEMRVRGVDRLRVVDASAMPDLLSAHLNAAVLMMAEKASDLIRGRSSAQIARVA